MPGSSGGIATDYGLDGPGTIHSYFHFWPLQRQAAIVCIHLVEHRMQRKICLTLSDCMDFLRRAKWKAYHKSPRQHRVGNYLDLIWLRHRDYNRRWITKHITDKKQQIKEKIGTSYQTTHRAHSQKSSGKPREPPNPHTRPENHWKPLPGITRNKCTKEQ